MPCRMSAAATTAADAARERAFSLARLGSPGLSTLAALLNHAASISSKSSSLTKSLARGRSLARIFLLALAGSPTPRATSKPWWCIRLDRSGWELRPAAMAVLLRGSTFTL